MNRCRAVMTTLLAVLSVVALLVVPMVAGAEASPPAAGPSIMPARTPQAEEPPAAFRALSRLPAAERAALTPLADAQLAAVEGAQGIPQDFFFDLNWSAFFLLLGGTAP